MCFDYIVYSYIYDLNIVTNKFRNMSLYGTHFTFTLLYFTLLYFTLLYFTLLTFHFNKLLQCKYVWGSGYCPVWISDLSLVHDFTFRYNSLNRTTMAGWNTSGINILPDTITRRIITVFFYITVDIYLEIKSQKYLRKEKVKVI